MKTLISVLLIAFLAGPASALTSATNHTDGGVTIRSSASTGVVLDPGDEVSFQYQSARDGAVFVFDIDTQGYVSLLSDGPVAVPAHTQRNLPDDGSQLYAEGEPGVEFVFAVAVGDPGAIDSDALNSLRDGKRQITGDPFVAANMITAEVVRNISQQTVFMGYTYFYVADRVDYPCYLCGNCDGTGAKSECAGYQVAQNFDQGVSLVYPLARGYDMVNVASSPAARDSTGAGVAMPQQQDDVNFYPYGSEVHYADPVALNTWYNWGWYDPSFYYYPYSYPYCGSPWSFSVGFGWGWGWGCGNGYYCSGWYNPYWGGCYAGYPSYPSYPAYSGNVVRFKSQYKSNYAANTLTQNRTYAMKHDGSLQVASKGTRSWGTPVPYRSKTMASTYPMASYGHVKTSVSGGRTVAQGAWADGRSKSYSGGTPYGSRNSAMYRNGNGGRTITDRGGYTRSRGASPSYGGNGTTRMKSGYYQNSNGTQYRSRGSWSPSNGTYSGSNSAPMMRGYSGGHQGAPAYHGGWSGGGWGGGGRGGYGGGGAMKGGGGGGGGHGRGR
jgi:hypothetical protein